jgi:low affinity Fe/Cu permease
MESGDKITSENKTPTWQWVAITSISIMLFLAAVLLNETRADIQKSREMTSALSERVSVIETGMPLQFEAIKEWRSEINTNLEQLKAVQMDTNKMLTKSAQTYKEWKAR